MLSGGGRGHGGRFVKKIRQGHHGDLNVVASQGVVGIGERQAAVGFGERRGAIWIGIRHRDQSAAWCGRYSASVGGASAAGTVDDHAQQIR
jgi:hypothetical protein